MNFDSAPRHAFMELLSKLGEKLSTRVYLAGGVVRDIFLDALESLPDMDFVVEGAAEEFAKEAASATGGVLRAFNAFRTFKVERPSIFPFLPEFDIATARAEFYKCPGALPDVSPATIREDLLRRDFTVNSMAIRLEDFLVAARQGNDESNLADRVRPLVIDLSGGLQDLADRKIRVLHERSFVDDPTRMFRACRYAARISGEIEEETRELLKAAIETGSLSTISWFRVLTEMRKLLQEKQRKQAFDLLDQCGLLKALPFLPSENPAEAVQAIRRLAATTGDVRGALLYNVMLRIIVFFSNDNGEALFRSAGLTRHDRDAILRDVHGQDELSPGLECGLLREALGRD